jgi:hypothetical protein
MKLRVFRILVGLVLLPIAALTAAEFYVSSSGNDANAGAKAQPFATLVRARRAARAAAKPGVGRVNT